MAATRSRSPRRRRWRATCSRSRSGRSRSSTPAKLGKAHFPVRVLTFPRRAKRGRRRRAPDRAAIVARSRPTPRSRCRLPKLDIVTVPHLFGAMENPGLITFDARHRVRRRSRDYARDRRARARAPVVRQLRHARVVGRPVAVGGVRELARRAGRGAERGRIRRRSSTSRSRARTRSPPTAKPARQPLHRPVAFDPDNAFDSIAYDKGEAVLAMFERWVKPDVFRAALRAYLQAHANGSVTTADLVAALTRRQARSRRRRSPRTSITPARRSSSSRSRASPSAARRSPRRRAITCAFRSACAPPASRNRPARSSVTRHRSRSARRARAG